MSSRMPHESENGVGYSWDPNELDLICRVKCYMLHSVVARTASLCVRDILVTGSKRLQSMANLS